MTFLLTACGVSGDQIAVNKPQHKGSNAKKRIAGVLICAGFIASVIWKRIKAKKNGYQQSNLYGDIAKCVIITAVVMFVCIKLYSYKGLPTILILLAIIVAAYAYYTSKTVSGRYYYAGS